jgi:hypothetical protein
MRERVRFDRRVTRRGVHRGTRRAIIAAMDHAVSLVQAYLQLNGYFTSAEYPIMAAAGRNGFRTLTDIDILAFRFPAGVPISLTREEQPPVIPIAPAAAAPGVPGARATRSLPQGLDLADLDPGLGIPADRIDLIIGEVKEGRVGINSGARQPDVLKAVIDRFGHSIDKERLVSELLDTGTVIMPSGYQVRFIAFGAFPPGEKVPPCRIISLGHVLRFLQDYVRRHWGMLRHCQFKDPAFGFLMTMEKARRGGAGRRGEQGVEVVPRESEQTRVAHPRPARGEGGGSHGARSRR